MAKFNIGDKVHVEDFGNIFDGVIGEFRASDGYLYVWQDKLDGSMGNIFPSTKGFNYSYVVNPKNVKLLSSPNTLKSMSIKEKFIISLLPEPEKSFRKAGITNEDGLITEDGQTLLMTWLLNQYKATFNDQVVQPLLAEKKDEECK